MDLLALEPEEVAVRLRPAQLLIDHIQLLYQQLEEVRPIFLAEVGVVVVV